MPFDLVEVNCGPVVRLQIVQENGAAYKAANPTNRFKISGSRSAATFIREKANIPAAVTEEFWVVPLDCKNRVLCCYKAGMGTLTQSLAHPRELFRPVLMTMAAGFIVAHNHPSGDPSPSPEDTEVTKRLKACADILALTMVDHMIIGSNERYFSYADANWPK